ncbi:hypothetical protein ACP275_14G051400 [Erythranthe tilingii]
MHGNLVISDIGLAEKRKFIMQLSMVILILIFLLFCIANTIDKFHPSGSEIGIKKIRSNEVRLFTCRWKLEQDFRFPSISIRIFSILEYYISFFPNLFVLKLEYIYVFILSSNFSIYKCFQQNPIFPYLKLHYDINIIIMYVVS